MSSSPETLPARPAAVPGVRWLSTPRLLAISLGASVLWAYWPTLRDLATRWSDDPQYSHGYLVPVFALFLLWRRRPMGAAAPSRGAPWGLALLAAAVAVRASGAYLSVPWIEEISLFPCLLGGCLLLGGWNAVRWAWPAIAFLLFMIPLPFQVERALARPLQHVATVASTCSLEMLGFRATSEGNIIWINDETRIGVVEACGGLSMLLAFFALAVAFALALRQPPLDKIVIIASAVPIALFANVARITLTGILHELTGSAAAHFFFHDLAGWFMMLLALAVLWLEQRALARLLVQPKAS